MSWPYRKCELIRGSQLPDRKFYRIMYPDLRHYNFHWKLGENTDILPFMPFGNCERGGLYFTTGEQLLNFFCNYTSAVKLLDHWLAEVKVAPDEQVWSEFGKWKAHRVTVLSLTRIGDMDLRSRIGLFSEIRDDADFDGLLESFVSRMAMGMSLIEPELETEHLVVTAIFYDSEALRYVADQTFEVCRFAVAMDADAVEFIRDRAMKRRVRVWLLKNTKNNKAEV